MKKIFLFFFLLIISMGQSQNLITNGDFENGTTGWSGNAANVVTELGNSYNSANVTVAGNPWDVNLSRVLNIPASGVQYKLTFDAFSDTTRPLIAGIGLNQAPWTNTTQSVTLGTSLQNFELFFTSNFSSPTSRIIFDMGNATGFVGIDNVVLEIVGSPPASLPTTNAPVPTQLQSNVVSVFSNSYTNIGTNYDPNWGQSGHTQVNTNFEAIPGSGNSILAYPNFNYQGTEVVGSNLSSMEFLHIDIWTNAPTSTAIIQVSPINSGSGSNETLVTINHIQGQWASVDIPKSAFTSMTWSNVFQMKFAANGPGSTTPIDIYLDNVYFWKAPVLLGTDASLSNLQIDGVQVASFNSTINSYTVNLPIGTTVIPQITSATTTDVSATSVINQATALPGSATVVVTSQNTLVQQTYTVNFAFPPPPSQPVGLVALNPTASSVFLAVGPNNVGGNIVYKLFYSPTSSAPANPLTATEHTFGSIPGDGNGVNAFGFNLPGLSSQTNYTFWLYQYNSVSELYSTPAMVSLTTLAPPPPVVLPTTNAPIPIRNAANVISLFSDSYSNIATNYDPNWGQSGHNQVNSSFIAVPSSGNNILAYPNFNYQGTLLTATNLSAMEFLHVDLWTNAPTSSAIVKVSPINAGSGANEVQVQINHVQGQWVSVDIPKSAFTGMTWDNVFQMIFAANGPGSTTPISIYLDNVYFWNNPGVNTDATLSDLQVDFATVSGFSPSTQTYTYTVPFGTTTIPQISSATTSNFTATTVITQATSLPGSATVVVTAEDTTVQLTYTVNIAFPPPPAQPVGFVAQTPTSTTTFLACGPNNVDGNVVYRLFYSPTASAPANPTTGTEYVFGSTAGDGNSVAPFGFIITGLTPLTNYTYWLYQYNTSENQFSVPAIATLSTLPLTTSVKSPVCGSTLATVNSLVQVFNFGASANVTGYRFKATGPGGDLILEKATPHFQFSELTGWQYGTSYTVSCELRVGTLWTGSYGPTCQISTPNVIVAGLSQVVSPTCGSTVAMNAGISTTSLAGVTGYRFRVTNTTLGYVGTNAVQVIDRTVQWFRMNLLPEYIYGSTYTVEVAVKTTGDYGAYGLACTLSTLAVPSLNQCGTTVAAGTLISTTSLAGVTQYTFEVTNMSTEAVQYINRPTQSLPTTSITGYSSTTAYSIRVALTSTGVMSPYGLDCLINDAPANREADSVDETFKVNAFPNPFTNNFTLAITRASEENVSVMVYDMIGKLLNKVTVNATDNSLELGANYPAGVYNVVVSQGEKVETVRMIKQ